MRPWLKAGFAENQPAPFTAAIVIAPPVGYSLAADPE
jgi:hypothetical protein